MVLTSGINLRKAERLPTPISRPPITQIEHHLIFGLTMNQFKLVITLGVLVNDEFHRFGQDTMFTAAHPTQHLLVRANAEKADVQVIGFGGQVEGRFALFGRVDIVAVAGDAAKLNPLERFVQMVERQEDEMFA